MIFTGDAGAVVKFVAAFNRIVRCAAVKSSSPANRARLSSPTNPYRASRYALPKTNPPTSVPSGVNRKLLSAKTVPSAKCTSLMVPRSPVQRSPIVMLLSFIGEKSSFCRSGWPVGLPAWFLGHTGLHQCSHETRLQQFHPDPSQSRKCTCRCYCPQPGSLCRYHLSMSRCAHRR